MAFGKLSSMPIVTTRPAVPANDETFLYELYALGRRHEMSSILNWSELQKQEFIKNQYSCRRQHYIKTYPNSQRHIIVCDSQAVGTLWLDWGEKKLHILDLAVLPKYQGQGLAGQILDQLTMETDRRDITTELYSEVTNLDARRFYEQFGFVVKQALATHVLYCREPKKRLGY